MVQKRMSTGSAAKIAGLSIATIKRKIQSKELRAERTTPGGDWRIQNSDLMEFLSTYKQPGRAGANTRACSTAADATTSRLQELTERENRELKTERTRLLEKLELVERENRDIRREYNAMLVRILAEKDAMIHEIKTHPAAKTSAAEDVPTQFLSKLKSVVNSRDIDFKTVLNRACQTAQSATDPFNQADELWATHNKATAFLRLGLAIHFATPLSKMTKTGYLHLKKPAFFADFCEKAGYQKWEQVRDKAPVLYDFLLARHASWSDDEPAKYPFLAHVFTEFAALLADPPRVPLVEQLPVG